MQTKTPLTASRSWREPPRQTNAGELASSASRSSSRVGAARPQSLSARGSVTRFQLESVLASLSNCRTVEDLDKAIVERESRQISKDIVRTQRGVSTDAKLRPQSQSVERKRLRRSSAGLASLTSSPPGVQPAPSVASSKGSSTIAKLARGASTRLLALHPNARRGMRARAGRPTSGSGQPAETIAEVVQAADGTLEIRRRPSSAPIALEQSPIASTDYDAWSDVSAAEDESLFEDEDLERAALFVEDAINERPIRRRSASPWAMFA